MKKIDKPNIEQEDVCDCFRSFKYKNRVITKSEEYDSSFLQTTVFLQDEQLFSTQDAKFKDYMVTVYENRLSKSSSPSYRYYKQIKGEIDCPYCNFTARTATQLDHYLPKAHFPTLAVTVNNLVPICSNCNQIKDDYFNIDNSKMLLHPYYDEEMKRILEFLKCEIVESTPIGFNFYIEKLSDWDETLFQRVKYHFKKLEIDRLYLSDFLAAFNVKLIELSILFEQTSSLEAVEEQLKREITALNVTQTRPWEHVGLKSILENEWCFTTYFPQQFSIYTAENDLI